METNTHESLDIKPKEIIIIDETVNLLVAVCTIAGMPVRVVVDRVIKSIEFNADDLAVALGFEDAQDAMCDDRFIDFVNGLQSQTGAFPLRQFFNEDGLTSWNLVVTPTKQRA